MSDSNVPPLTIPSTPAMDDFDDNLDVLITPLTAVQVSSTQFKEKFVSMYEALFAGKELYRTREHFWEELFLLRVNSQYLENCILLSSEDELLRLTKIIHTIFQVSLDALLDISPIRRTNALQVCFSIKLL
jgi:hypothetical protein